MASANINGNVVVTTTHWDKCGLFIVVTTVIILVTVITGILVKFLVDDPLSNILLIIFICFLCVVGIISLTILEIRRRRHRNIVQAVPAATVRNGGRTYHPVAPSAPQLTSWEYSNRETLPVS